MGVTSASLELSIALDLLGLPNTPSLGDARMVLLEAMALVFQIECPGFGDS